MIKIELPKPLILLIAILLISVIVSIVLLLYDINILWAVADIALVITLVAVVFYVYYTYLLAKETWTPSASFQFKQKRTDVFHFDFSIKSYSKSSLECWCNLNATVNGKPVSLTGFYANQSPVLLQPFGEFDGHFDIRPLLAQVNYTINQMKKEYEENNKKGQLYFDIEFYYSPIGQKKKVHNPTQPYFFDFDRLMLIKDF